MRLNRKGLLVFLAVLAGWPAGTVWAQQGCDTPFEVIVTLRPPPFGFPTVWDAKYGIRDMMVQLGSGVTQEGGTVLAIGRSFSMDDYKTKDILLADINRRGRVLKEERYPAKEAEEPVKMIRSGKELVAISNMRGGKGNAEKWARLSWYDGDGRYLRERILKDSVFDYESNGLLQAVEGKGFVAILHAVNRSDAGDENGVLIRFSPQGDVVWRRAYRPGIPNEINGLNPMDESNYIATGRIRLDDGRQAGWAMKLGYDGAVHWQRTYPRGEESVFRTAALSGASTANGHGFILAGDTVPLDKGPRAAWVMETDALGEPRWQRYFRRPDAALSGDWVRSEPDGRKILIMNARIVEGQSGHNYVRMVTLSPRGAVIGDEAYYEGLQTRATDYVEGWNGERVMTAVIQDETGGRPDEQQPITVIGPGETADQAAAAAPELEPDRPVYKGWIFIATALDPYDDPCGK